MSLDHRLIELLVCPICKGPLVLARDAAGGPQALHCAADHLAFPIRDGIPLLLEGEAVALAPEGAAAPPPEPSATAG